MASTAPTYKRHIRKGASRQFILDRIFVVAVMGLTGQIIWFVLGNLFFWLGRNFGDFAQLVLTVFRGPALFLSSWLVLQRKPNAAFIVRLLLVHYEEFKFSTTVPRRRYHNFGPEGCLPLQTSATSRNWIPGICPGMPLDILELVLSSIRKGGNSVQCSRELVSSTLATDRPHGEYAIEGTGQASIENDNGLRRIKLESPIFERRFGFYGTDRVQGRSFMTPARIERWEQFSKALGQVGFSVYLADRRVSIALTKASGWVDPCIVREGRFRNVVCMTYWRTTLITLFHQLFSLPSTNSRSATTNQNKNSVL
ncbi:MAG: DUF3137 domain-containing protein [Alphaproteobacteria bacterium]